MKGGRAKPKILFPCADKSCRKRMVNGRARHLKKDQLEPFSAGVEAHGGLNPAAIGVMTETGPDISGHRSTKPPVRAHNMEVQRCG